MFDPLVYLESPAAKLSMDPAARLQLCDQVQELLASEERRDELLDERDHLKESNTALRALLLNAVWLLGVGALSQWATEEQCAVLDDVVAEFSEAV